LLVFALGWVLDKLHYQFLPYAGWASLAALTVLCFVLLPLIATLLYKRPLRPALLLRWPANARSTAILSLVTLMLVPAYITLVLVLARHLPSVRRMALGDIREIRFTLAQTHWALIAVGGLFFAFGEEFMFRGFLMNALRCWGGPAALGASAICFAFAHHSVGKLIPITLAGLWFAYVALRTGSIFASTLAHFIVNATLLGTVAYALRHQVVGRRLPAPPDWYLLPIVSWFALLIWLLERFCFRRRDSTSEMGVTQP
jgi:membrane protease YdiL (CAAX protease family)